MPLDLRLYGVSGSFNTVQMDQQWIDIEDFVNGLEITTQNLDDSLDMLTDYVGIQVLRGVQTVTVSAQTDTDIVLPNAATWDELEFHFSMRPSETASLEVRASGDGGATFESSASSYFVSDEGTSFSSANAIVLGTTVNPATEGSMQGILRLYKRISGMETLITVSGASSRGVNGAFDIRAYRTELGTDVNALRFYSSAGTMTGRIAVMAVKYP